VSACTADPAGHGPSTVHDTIECPDPGLRGQMAYDEIVLDGQGETDRRFWGGGIVAGDFDGDSDLDLVAPGPHIARYLRNDGGVWTDDPTVLPERDWSFAAGGSAADYDADGDLDLLITAWGPPSALLHNDGGTFVDVELPVPPAYSQSAAWRDVEGDGDLDVVVAGHGAIDPGQEIVITEPGSPTRLWLGDGQGGFVDGSRQWFDDPTMGAYTYVAGWTELNEDGKPDLMLANDYPIWLPSFAALHQGDRFQSDPAGLGLTVFDAGMGLGVGDANGDFVDDFLMPVWDRVVLLMSVGGRWVDSAAAAGMVVPPHDGDGQWIGWGGEWGDIDNDGDMDAIVAYGRLDAVVDYTGGGGPSADNDENQRFAIYLQQSDGTFVEAAEALALGRYGAWRGFVATDLNGDGWLDLARRDLNGPIVINLSRCGEQAWLRVQPTPAEQAIGARIFVTAGGTTQVRTVQAGGTSLNSGGPPEVHFGLGSVEDIDEIEIRWPDGHTTKTGPTWARQVLQVNP
jgi:hypothetical protein